MAVLHAHMHYRVLMRRQGSSNAGNRCYALELPTPRAAHHAPCKLCHHVCLSDSSMQACSHALVLTHGFPKLLHVIMLSTLCGRLYWLNMYMLRSITGHPASGKHDMVEPSDIYSTLLCITDAIISLEQHSSELVAIIPVNEMHAGHRWCTRLWHI